MDTITLDLKEFANGGSVVGRASRRRTVFVPFGIPGEKVRVDIQSEHNKFAHGRILKVLRASADRVEPVCTHFASCGGCHFQHMTYEAQLRAKRDVVSDQLARIGQMKGAPVMPVRPHPSPWGYRREMVLSPAGDASLGYWSPFEKRVIPIEMCPISEPRLLELLEDMDLDLPGLRKMTLRLGDDGALLAAVEVDGVEAPQLQVDFPLSVAIVLPDKTAVNLVSDNYTLQTVNGRDFRLSAGCSMPVSPAGMALLVEAVLGYAALDGSQTVLDLYSGVGILSAFLADEARAVVAIERQPDAVADMVVNLDVDHLALYEGDVETVLPELEVMPDVVVMHPPAGGLSQAAVQQVTALAAARLIYVSSDVATFARDGRQFNDAGYHLREVQPVDMRPQTYHVDLVGCWERVPDTKN